MKSIPCPNGLRQATALASMNLRAVVGLYDVSYVVVPRQESAPVTTAVSARFQPRDSRGRFLPFTELWSAINLEYAMTAYEYDADEQYDDGE